MQFISLIPVLRVFDEQKAKEFYLDFLSFRLDWEHRFEPNLPLYMQVSREDCMLHLSEHYGDATPGSTMRIQVNNLDALQAEMNAKQYGYARPEIEAMPWGSRDMPVRDPFGNKLIFTTPINP